MGRFISERSGYTPGFARDADASLLGAEDEALRDAQALRRDRHGIGANAIGWLLRRSASQMLTTSRCGGMGR